MSSPTQPIFIVHLLDSWFPSKNYQRGSVGGAQVRVKSISKLLNPHVQSEIFFPAHPSIIIFLFWPIIILFQLIIYSRRHPFHLIHAHGYQSAIAGKIASYILKKPLILTIHGTPWLDQKQTTLRGMLEKIIFTKIKYHAQISIAKSFLKHPNINHHIHIIRNGVDLKSFNQIKVKKAIHPTLIWVGKKDPTKGLDILKQAIKRVRKTYPNLKANLISGHLNRHQLIKSYKQAHLFVLPSIGEGQPITLLEAWAAKLPIIVTKVGDNQDMIQDGINGLLIEPNNVSQLSDAIQKILRARVLHHRLSQAGYETVKKHYSWKNTALKTQKVYQQVLNSFPQGQLK